MVRVSLKLLVGSSGCDASFQGARVGSKGSAPEWLRSAPLRAVAIMKMQKPEAHTQESLPFAAAAPPSAHPPGQRCAKTPHWAVFTGPWTAQAGIPRGGWPFFFFFFPF